MRARRSVDLLPTISEMQEGEVPAGDPELPVQSMEEYLASIKELSQPASYPLHGPLRGHRRWLTRTVVLPLAKCAGVVPLSAFSSMAYAPWAPLGPSHVSLTAVHRPDCAAFVHSRRDPLDWLFAQSQLTGVA